MKQQCIHDSTILENQKFNFTISNTGNESYIIARDMEDKNLRIQLLNHLVNEHINNIGDKVCFVSILEDIPCNYVYNNKGEFLDIRLFRQAKKS